MVIRFTPKVNAPSDNCPGNPPLDHTPQNWSVLSIEQAARLLKSDLALGLTGSESDQRLRCWGINHLRRHPGRPVLTIALDQFRSLIVVLLLVATILAYYMDGVLEAMMILVVILLNAAIGFFTEWQAQRALISLEQQDIRLCRVIRNGTQQRIATVHLVSGDLVILEAGDRIPADGRILESHGLQVDESALTGESIGVEKVSEPLPQSTTSLGDLINMGFMGTLIDRGHGRMLVTATGARTELGKIGGLINEASKRESPLEGRLQRLGANLAGIVVVLCAVMVVAGMLRAMPFLQMLQIALSLAIAAVPEGLLAVSTMTLAIGMQRMARQGVLIRNLAAVETLGAATVICTDKTGTLTRNEMTVEKLVVDDRTLSVSGNGYKVQGSFSESAGVVDVHADESVIKLLQIGALCNDARVTHTTEKDVILGDPTEAALIVLAEKAGIDLPTLNNRYPRVCEIPFSTEKKWMMTEHGLQGLPPVGFAKGAPLRILGLCKEEAWQGGIRPLTAERRHWWEDANTRLANESLRVLGFCCREGRPQALCGDVETHWVFAGLVGMIDPLRSEAHSAITRCREAGIATIMITGDQVATARGIARRLGIDRATDGSTLETVHAQALAQSDPDLFNTRLARIAVFARAEPRHKLEIVRGLQQSGHVVAMTGDGVNDAPALRQADIGIAMGSSGTDVARQSADMVITDDNFVSIVHAVEQGRVLYANIIHFVHYLLSCNFAELLTVFLAIMFGWPLPLAPLQILWLNMVTDIFPALGLALEPRAPGIMKCRPRSPDSALLTPMLMLVIAWQGLLLAITTLVAFYIGLQWYPEHVEHAATMAFMTLAFVQIFHALNVRSRRRSALTRSFATNKWLWSAMAACMGLQLLTVSVPALRVVLGTTALQIEDWAVILGCSVVPVAVVELTKLTCAWTRRKAGATTGRQP
ncbi:cation-translocating P-type ATPase [Pseudomonas sp. Pseusp122]|uniref:cation-translocating P-type ATPase n=1 Tax=unclassified Pseudomonas TaxID=196821 RepID=UPI0039A47566